MHVAQSVSELAGLQGPLRGFFTVTCLGSGLFVICCVGRQCLQGVNFAAEGSASTMRTIPTSPSFSPFYFILLSNSQSFFPKVTGTTIIIFLILH